MKWERLLRIVEKEPVFSSALLKAGSSDPVNLGIQLSRWTQAGKLIQIRRGLYTLSRQYRKTDPHPFYIANRIKKASYVSLQSALEHYGLIPEYVPSVISVTTGRPQSFDTPLGHYIFRHIKRDLFSDYSLEEAGREQTAFIAKPEKALIDLLYLTPGSDDAAYIKELRLQNLDNLDFKELQKIARQSGSPKLIRSAKLIEEFL